ncbi:hypothetical protein VTJ04DRAFT_7315 [Mycothermus thermophilus]|uniref:uncharacterized protein n=1 Tax=Humicola insolens TaxID=85995 RepID=UPI003742E1F9
MRAWGILFYNKQNMTKTTHRYTMTGLVVGLLGVWRVWERGDGRLLDSSGSYKRRLWYGNLAWDIIARYYPGLLLSLVVAVRRWDRRETVIGFDLTAGYGVCSEEGVKWDLGGKQEKLAWVLVGKHGADGMVARVHQALATARQMTPPNEDDGIIDDDGTGHSNHCLVSSTSITTVRVGRRLRDTGRVRT